MSLSEIILMMLPAFAMCLVLVGIHSYLGVHVIKRKVIFIDLALAQIAALGTLVAYLFGIMPQTLGAYWFSLGLTAIAAGVFAITRRRHSKIPQEAVIGLVYAIAAALAVLLIDKAPHGAEHLKDIMTGHLLWIRWENVATAAIVYTLVGILHFVFRRRFILITEDPEKAFKEGMRVRLWEFIFYLSFGSVITLSVSSAGVLIVFVFLVAPAILSTMLFDSWKAQIIMGWIVGVILSTLGLVLSYVLDLPTGPAIIGTYGALLLLIAAGRYILTHDNRVAALRNALLTGIAFAAAFAAIAFSGYQLKTDAHHDHEAHQEAARTLPGERDDAMVNVDSDDFEATLAATEDIEQVADYYERVVEEDVKALVIRRALALDPKTGALLAMDFLRKEPPLFYAKKVVEALDAVMPEASGYDPKEAFLEPANQKAGQRIVAAFELPAETLFQCPEGTRMKIDEESPRKSAWCEEPGEVQGPKITWYESGEKASLEHFKAGQLNGKQITWHRNQQKASEGSFLDGQRHGTWRWFDESGAEQRSVRYDLGVEEVPAEPSPAVKAE